MTFLFDLIHKVARKITRFLIFLYLQPEHIITIATLTGASQIALGEAAAAMWSRNDDTFVKMEKAAFVKGDRVWRMPLFEYR